MFDTSHVGDYPVGASPYGAMDMSGDVSEWVNDWYDANYYDVSPASNPLGPANGFYKVLRGGSWGEPDSFVRAAYRSYVGSTQSDKYLGFRCAATGP